MLFVHVLTRITYPTVIDPYPQRSATEMKPSGGVGAPDGMSLNDWYLKKAQSMRVNAPDGDGIENRAPARPGARVQSLLSSSPDSGHSASAPLIPVFRSGGLASDGKLSEGDAAAARGGFVKRFTSMVQTAAVEVPRPTAPLVTFMPASVTISAPSSHGVGVRVMLEQPSSVENGFGFHASSSSPPRQDPVGLSGTAASKAPPIPNAMREALMEARRRMAKLKEEGRTVEPTNLLSGALGAYMSTPPGMKPDKVKKPQIGPEKRVLGASERLYPGPKAEPEPEPEPQEPVLRVRGASERLYPGPKQKDGEEDEEDTAPDATHGPKVVKRVRGASERLYPGPGGKPASSNAGALMDDVPEAAPAPAPVRRVIGASSRLYPGPSRGRRARRGSDSSSSSASRDASEGSEHDDAQPALGENNASPGNVDAVEAPAVAAAPVPKPRVDRASRPAGRTAARADSSVSPRRTTHVRGARQSVAQAPSVDGEAAAAADTAVPATVKEAAAAEDDDVAPSKPQPKPKIVSKNGAYINGKFVLNDGSMDPRKKPNAALCMKNLKKRTPGIDIKQGGKAVGLHWMFRACPGICVSAGSSGTGVFVSDNADSGFIPSQDWGEMTSANNDSMALGVRYLDWLDRFTQQPGSNQYSEFEREVAAAAAAAAVESTGGDSIAAAATPGEACAVPGVLPSFEPVIVPHSTSNSDSV